jgi:hypothetical protein
MLPMKPAMRARSLSFDQRKREKLTGSQVQSRGQQLTFRKVWDSGYGQRILPIIPPDAQISEKSSLFKRMNTRQDGRGKIPGVKLRYGEWVSFDWLQYATTESDLERWEAMSAGIGIRTGDGLVGIDADTLNLDCARIIREIVERHIGAVPARIGREPKCLYLVRVSDPLPYTRVEFGERDEKGRLKERVELLSEGRQFVAGGRHPATGKPYTWPRALVSFDDLPEVSSDTLIAMMEELRRALPAAGSVVVEGSSTRADVNQEALRGDVEKVRRAVSLIPNTDEHFSSRESSIGVGYAIKAALPNNEMEAFDIYADWCERWTGGINEHDVIAADWGRMHGPYSRGANWLYELAEQHSPDKFSRAEVWFEPIETVENSPFDVALAEKPEAKTFELITLQQAADTALQHSSKPLVKGLLDQGALSVCYGESNVGKTFVVMDIAFAVAAGLPWGGMRTTKLAVVYIAAEGGAGARKRSKALVVKYGCAAQSAAFFLLPSSVNLLRVDADLKPLIRTIKQLGVDVGLVVVDTLSRAMSGGDENALTDMGAMVKHLDAIRAETGAHVMAVHHSGKDRAKGARGHSLLRAATDTEIEISEGQITVQKQRDMDKTYAAAFVLDVHQLGTDADGDPVNSCTVRLVARDEARGKATPTESLVLDALDDATPLGSTQGVKTRDIAARAREAGLETDEEGIRAHLKNLRKKNLVRLVGRGIWARTAEKAEPSGFFSAVAENDENGAPEKSGMESGRDVFQ